MTDLWWSLLAASIGQIVGAGIVLLYLWWADRRWHRRRMAEFEATIRDLETRYGERP